MLLDNLPPATTMWSVRCAFINHLRRAVCERAVDNVGVTGHPADVGGTPVHIGFWFEIKNVVMREGRLRQVATTRVQDAFGLTGGARRVQNEEWMLGVENVWRVAS